MQKPNAAIRDLLFRDISNPSQPLGQQCSQNDISRNSVQGAESSMNLSPTRFMFNTSARNSDLSEELNSCFTDALFSTPNVLVPESISTSKMCQQVSPTLCGNYLTSQNTNAKMDNLSRKRKHGSNESDMICKTLCGNLQSSHVPNLNINGSNIRDPKHLVMDPNLLFSSGDSNDTNSVDSHHISPGGKQLTLKGAYISETLLQQEAQQNTSHIHAKPMNSTCSSNRNNECEVFTGRVINPPHSQNYYKEFYEKPHSSGSSSSGEEGKGCANKCGSASRTSTLKSTPMPSCSTRDVEDSGNRSDAGYSSMSSIDSQPSISKTISHGDLRQKSDVTRHRTSSLQRSSPESVNSLVKVHSSQHLPGSLGSQTSESVHAPLKQGQSSPSLTPWTDNVAFENFTALPQMNDCHLLSMTFGQLPNNSKHGDNYTTISTRSTTATAALPNEADFEGLDRSRQSGQLSEGATHGKHPIFDPKRLRAKENDSSSDSNTLNNRERRFNRTANALQKSGLWEVAMRTGKLIKRNQKLQTGINQLKVESLNFIKTVLKDPQNRGLIKHVLASAMSVPQGQKGSLSGVVMEKLRQLGVKIPDKLHNSSDVTELKSDTVSANPGSKNESTILLSKNDSFPIAKKCQIENVASESQPKMVSGDSEMTCQDATLLDPQHLQLETFSKPHSLEKKKLTDLIQNTNLPYLSARHQDPAYLLAKTDIAKSDSINILPDDESDHLLAKSDPTLHVAKNDSAQLFENCHSYLSAKADIANSDSASLPKTDCLYSANKSDVGASTDLTDELEVIHNNCDKQYLQTSSVDFLASTNEEDIFLQSNPSNNLLAGSDATDLFLETGPDNMHNDPTQLLANSDPAHLLLQADPTQLLSDATHLLFEDDSAQLLGETPY